VEQGGEHCATAIPTPNHGVQATAASVRSCLASAFGSGSRPALAAKDQEGDFLTA